MPFDGGPHRVIAGSEVLMGVIRSAKLVESSAVKVEKDRAGDRATALSDQDDTALFGGENMAMNGGEKGKRLSGYAQPFAGETQQSVELFDCLVTLRNFGDEFALFGF